MTKLYFICMGNYFRSRLAEELAWYYATQNGLEVYVDSGGLSDIPNSRNPGAIAQVTLEYLASKNITPRNATRFPKSCTDIDVHGADLVICTDIDEQEKLFNRAFPDYSGVLIGWQARDKPHPPLQTMELIDKNVVELINTLSKD